MPPETSEIVGIDLGTTHTLAAYVRDGRPEAVRDENGIALIPSVLAFGRDGQVTIGYAAKQQAIDDPTHTLFSIKRLMGRSLKDLESILPTIPQTLREVEREDGRKVLCVTMDGRDYTPVELSAMILQEARRRAGMPKKAVITVPAYFDDAQRQATRDAGRIAGLEVLRIVNEPTAAALAYGLDRKNSQAVAVYDLGGGTFDCSILHLQEGTFQVLATRGDTRLGGDDFDRLLARYVAEQTGIAYDGAEPRTLQVLRELAERIKIHLSTNDTFEGSVELPAGSKNVEVSRTEFEARIAPYVDRTLELCGNALRDAKMEVTSLNEVVLVGGSTRIPCVQKRVAEFFGRLPHKDLNPDEVVALGAAIQADILAGNNKETLLLDVVPLSLGIETLGGVVDKIIHRNSTVPCRETTRYTTSADNQTVIILNVFQGERELTRDCTLLGRFKLTGIPPMPAQMAQVDVTFAVDANGILKIHAKEKRSGAQIAVAVTAALGLSADEVERLVLESVAEAKADFRARQGIEFRNKAEADLRHTRKALAELGASLSVEEHDAIESAITALEAALQGDDPYALQTQTNRLGEVTLPLAERLMNNVVRSTLTGTTTQQLDPDAL